MEGRLPENVVAEYRQRAEASRNTVLNGMPKVKLKKINIQNCKVLLDREELLGHLPKGSIVAEIGVNKGEFSQQIIDVCEPEKLHLIDAWHSERYHEGLALLVEKKFTQQISSDLVEINRGLSTDVVDSFPSDYLDWIYIDTVHDYDTTKIELEKYSKKMKNGGIIAGHDYSMGNWVKGYKYGVIEAVHEFCVNNHWELIFLTVDFTENQSFAIRKILT
jgi:hypothetical protein